MVWQPRTRTVFLTLPPTLTLPQVHWTCICLYAVRKSHSRNELANMAIFNLVRDTGWTETQLLSKVPCPRAQVITTKRYSALALGQTVRHRGSRSPETVHCCLDRRCAVRWETWICVRQLRPRDGVPTDRLPRPTSMSEQMARALVWKGLQGATGILGG